MIGQLYTQDFLKTGIGDTPAWQGITDAELDVFIAGEKGGRKRDAHIFPENVCVPFRYASIAAPRRKRDLS